MTSWHSRGGSGSLSQLATGASKQRQSTLPRSMDKRKYALQALFLLLLTVQTSTLTLYMRHSLHTARYNPASVVVVVEICKIILSAMAEILFTVPRRWNIVRVVGEDIFGSGGGHFIKLSLPAALYAIQNNLSYYALARLPAVTFQVILQLKILTTALMAVLLLDKRLSVGHWISLGMLTAGVVLVQISTSTSTASAVKGTLDRWLGFGAIVINSLSSGFAGIYYERIIKSASRNSNNRRKSFNTLITSPSPSQSAPSLWIQSLELGLFGLLFSLLLAFLTPSSLKRIMGSEGFFGGFNRTIWIVILMQSFGGMLVALVVRHTDSILKAFSTSASIVLSSFISFGFMNNGDGGGELRIGFIGGASLVMISVLLYSLSDHRQAALLKTR